MTWRNMWRMYDETPTEYRTRARAALGLPRYAPTEAGLTEAILASTSWVRAVEWRYIGPGMGVAKLRFKWWGWLFPVVAQAIADRRTQTALNRWASAAAVILVEVW